MVLVKNLKIFYLSILGKTGQNNTFRDILEGKNVYLDNKNKKLKKSKNQNFSKGDSPWVMSKNWKFFHLFISGKISPENASNDILQRKNAFLDYKNKNLIKSKNKHSFKGVGPCFWSKISNFAIFIFVGKQARSMRFTTFQKGRTPFQTTKTKS